jgi:hypothetical protein
MILTLYMDVHVKRAVSHGLRARGVDVLTAQDDGADQSSDSDLLDRATALGRVLFSQDEDLLREAARRQRQGQAFGGLVFCHQLRLTVGQIIADLELISKASESVDMASRVEYLPL